MKLPPGNDSIANYYIDMESGQFALWSNLVPSTRALIAKAVSSQFAISDSLNALDDPPPLKNQIEVDLSLVPTVDTLRYAFLVALIALNGQPVLLTGETGTGKSALIQGTFVRLSQAGELALKRELSWARFFEPARNTWCTALWRSHQATE